MYFRQVIQNYNSMPPVQTYHELMLTMEGPVIQDDITALQAIKEKTHPWYGKLGRV